MLTFSVADHFFEPILLGADPILQLSVFMVAACSIILGVSRRGGSFMLSILKYIIQLCFMREINNPESLCQRDKKLLSGFPINPRSIEANDPLGHSATSTKCGHVFTQEEMNQIRSNIAFMAYLHPNQLRIAKSRQT